jgi:hypothetical protein
LVVGGWWLVGFGNSDDPSFASPFEKGGIEGDLLLLCSQIERNIESKSPVPQGDFLRA